MRLAANNTWEVLQGLCARRWTDASRPGVPSVAADPAIRAVRGEIELGPRDAVAEPPWPEFPAGQEIRWERFMRFPGPFEAHIVAGRLDVEGVPAVVLSALGVDLANAAEILVPRHLMHRARWVLAWPPMSDEELQFLATGEIGTVAEGS